MGKKGLVTAIFSRLVETSLSSSPGSVGGVRASPSCWNNPQTTSFRAGDDDEDPRCTTARRAGGPDAATGRLQLRGAAAGGEMYRTVNSVYFDPAAADEISSLDGGEEEEVLDLDDESCCFASEEWSEAVIRSLGRSTSTHRFFFDPGPPSVTPILPTAVSAAAAHPDDDGKKQRASMSEPPSSLAEGSVAVAVDSADPFGDFRASMEEMVAAHGLRDWAALEELLSWYFRVNGKHNHPVIVAAFVDVLVDLASSTAATTATTTSITTSSGKSTKSSCTTSATSTTTMTAPTEQCGRGADEASSRSSSSSSCATPDDSRSQDDVAEEKTSDPGSSDGDHTRHKSEL